MDNEALEYQSKIFFYFREKYYNSMLATCKDAIAKFKTEVSFQLYHALALLLNNRLEECVNELDAIKNENEIRLSVVIALMYAHKMLGIANKDLFQRLDAQMREYRKSAEAIDFYHSAFVLFALNKPEKSIDYLDKSLNVQSDLREALALKGWVLLNLKKMGLKSSTHNIGDIFDLALKSGVQNMDANLGLAESYLVQGKFEDAVAAANKAIIRFPRTVLPLVKKMKILFAAQDWEQSVETINRILNADSNNLEAIKMNVVTLLVKDASFEEAAILIRKFTSELDVQEAKNYQAYLDNAQLFSKITSRNGAILKETYKMCEKAVQINSESIKCIVELGTQSLMQNHVREAIKYFKTATKLNESSFDALLGLTFCELAENGHSDQVKKQIEFLLELEEAQTSARLYLIRAKIADNAEEAQIFLKKAVDLQLNSVKFQPYSERYLQLLDPDFMLEVIRQILQYISCSTDPHLAKGSSVRISSSSAASAQNALKILTKSCPGLYEAGYLLAKLQFFTGDTANAMNTLDQILSHIDDAMSSDAHLLMAQIQVQCGYYERAAQSLEVGLSHNFQVRESPVYHFIRGMVDKHTNNLHDTIKSLTTALSLVALSQEQSNITLTEKVSIYIELIEVHNMIGQVDESAKLLENAIEEFKGTPEEARIRILCAEHALDRKNVQGAIDLLQKVQPNESYYLQARTKLADILLKYRMDRFAYLQCYQDMVDENPKAESYLLLGDAYMTILEPDDALECYKMALQQNPMDPYLTSKMGRALVETHYFSKAVTFYIDSIKLTDNSELKLQLADLYMQLKQYEKAQDLLMKEIDVENAKKLDDLTYLQYKTKLQNLLAQTQERAGNLSAALITLKEAWDNQNRVRKRLQIEQTNVPEEEIRMLVDIGVKLAEISTTLKNNDQAIQFYKDALEVLSDDVNILAALAKLYMQMNLLDPCQQVCANILRLDAENETASIMMADIAFRKIDFDMALFHFTQLLTKQPTNWHALVRLVEIMRRTGNLNDVPEYLSNAERFVGNAAKDPGFLYCNALYEMYMGNLNGALRKFNAARQDAEWGMMALVNMIEICLNPDDELLGEQFIDGDDEYRDSRSMALKTADRLLNELKNRLDSSGEDMFKYKLLVNFRLLASQEKYNIERGLEDFIAMASLNPYKDHVGPILGMSTAYTLLKQSQRAKNQLKRLAKTSWTFEDAEYLERCWLLLADYYIQSAKYDVAADLLSKVVQHNRACNKAYEYLGFISEKEQRYKDAVNNYELAWRYGGKTNPSVGFKLAYNLMKCKNYADAIDIGQQILKLSPGYPKVKKDILDKSMNNLRV